MRAGPRSDRKGIGAYASTPVLSWTWGASLLAPAATGADCGNPQPGCTPTKFSSNPRTSPIAQGLGRSQQWLHDATKNRVALQRTANAIRPPTARQTRNPTAEPAQDSAHA